MAVTFRGAKGAALTHAELDHNFGSFVTDGSVSNTTLTLYRSSSTDPTFTIELPKAGGSIGNIQLKKDDQGNWEGVESLNYKWWDQELFFTGSTFQKGNIYLEGTIYAHQFETTLISSSVIYKSGSSKFGDTTDDLHAFTGSIRATRDIQTNNDLIADGAIIAGTGLVFNNFTVDGNINTTRLYGNTDFNTILNKPTLVSGSSQVVITNTTGFYNYSGSIHDQREARLTELSSSTQAHIEDEVTALGQQVDNEINALSSSTALVDAIEKQSRIASSIATNNSITALSSSTATVDQALNNSITALSSSSGAIINSNYTALNSAISTENAQRVASITGLSSSIDLSRLKNTTDTLDGDLTVTGKITAQEFNTEYITSSVIFESGSTKFGNTSDDTHDFTGTITSQNNISSSATIYAERIEVNDQVDIVNDLIVQGEISADKVEIGRDLTVSRVTTLEDLVVNGSITGATIGNSVSASYATTASYANFANTARLADGAENAVTASYALSALTASYALNAGSALTSETDPIFTASPSFGILQADIDDWDTAAGWGNHQDEGYAKVNASDAAYVRVDGSNFIEADLKFKNSGEGINFQEYNTGYSTSYRGHIKYTSDPNLKYPNQLQLASEDAIQLEVDGSPSLVLTDITADFTVPVTSTGDIVAFNSSDKRLKENIKQISNPIEKLKQIGGYEFDWNDKQTLHVGHDVGVIAQEVEKVLPEIVANRDNGYKAVRYEKLVALLIEAVKEQQLQIDELKAKL